MVLLLIATCMIPLFLNSMAAIKLYYPLYVVYFDDFGGSHRFTWMIGPIWEIGSGLGVLDSVGENSVASTKGNSLV